MKFEDVHLGDTLQHSLTGFTGRCSAKHEYAGGFKQVTLQVGKHDGRGVVNYSDDVALFDVAPDQVPPTV